MEEEANAKEETLMEKAYDCLRRSFSKRGLVLLIVTIALFLDNMLLTTVGESKMKEILFYWCFSNMIQRNCKIRKRIFFDF